MKIAATADGKNRDAVICPAFETSPYLLIFETDTGEITDIIENNGVDGVKFVNAMVRNNCEALVCGPIQSQAFEMISSACITRYNGVGLHAGEAVWRAETNNLEYIRDYEGGTGCDEHENEEDDYTMCSEHSDQ